MSAYYPVQANRVQVSTMVKKIDRLRDIKLLITLGGKAAKSLLIVVLSFCCLKVFANTTYGGNWQAPERLDHPWVGKVWDQANQVWISQDKLLNVLPEADYLLIGEKHDNPDHHLLQRWLLSQITDLKVQVVFEMLQEKQSKVSLPANAKLTELEKQLKWQEMNKGWPWTFYGPLIKETNDNGGAVRGAGFSREKLMRIYGGDIPEEHLETYEDSYAQTLQTLLEKDIEVSHCNKLPKAQIAPMVTIQRLRDIAMAKGMIDGMPRSKVGHKMKDVTKRENTFDRTVLIAGNFHVRTDVGVPYYLKFFPLPKDARIISISLQEVPEHSQEKSKGDSTLLIAPQKQSSQNYDFVWYTPAVESKDYCADL